MWGSGALDYWTALRRGKVDEPERIAVQLLSTIVDEYRFGLYCAKGFIPALGNITGKTYCVMHIGGVFELDDGEIIATWCIHIPRSAPPTDNVVVLKNLIEGSEHVFRKTGNRAPIRMSPWWLNTTPYSASIVRGKNEHRSKITPSF